MSSQLVAQVAVAAKVYLILISLILPALAVERRQTKKGEEAIVNNLT
jgi:uncharacterized membrane protein YqaE (UPF0057 family)